MRKRPFLRAALALAALLVAGCSDDVDPVDLKVSSTTATSITLEMHTPYASQDGTFWEPVDRYELYYTASPTVTSISAMTKVAASALPSPGVPRGALVTATVTGLESETQYWFIGRGFYDGGSEQTPRITGTTGASLPSDPTLLAQASVDGATPISTPGVSDRPGLQLQARVSSPKAGAILQLEVEIQPLGVPFTNQPTHSSAFVAGGSTAVVAVGPLPASSSYHWQARTIEANGTASGWVAAGTQPDIASEIDFSIRANAPPAAPDASQYDPAAGTAIEAGGDFMNAGTVRFAAAVTDVDPGEELRLEVELRRPGTAFLGVATDAGAAVPAGGVAEVVARAGDGAWKWQARTVDLFGAASAWSDYGGNSGDDADFLLIPAGSTGGSCPQSAGPGTAVLPAAVALLILLTRTGRA